jgi:hypothetical protein
VNSRGPAATPALFFQFSFLSSIGRIGRKRKAAKALGFRGPSSLVPHRWRHSSRNVRLSDFKSSRRSSWKSRFNRQVSLGKSGEKFFRRPGLAAIRGRRATMPLSPR